MGTQGEIAFIAIGLVSGVRKLLDWAHEEQGGFLPKELILNKTTQRYVKNLTLLKACREAVY